MSRPSSGQDAYRRARRAFWVLLVVAVLLAGVLNRLLEAPASQLVGMAFVAVGLVLVLVLALAVRLLLALTGRLPACREGRRNVR